MAAPDQGIPRANVKKALATVARFRETVVAASLAAPASEAATLGVPVVIYIIGARGDEAAPPATVRDFPLLDRMEAEASAAHLVRVARAVDAAIEAGGTHLLVPRAAANWLIDHPLVEEYFSACHELVEANAETGIVFALQR